MLTLESILRATRQATSYGKTGRHHFGESSIPRHDSFCSDPNFEEPKSGQVRVWDEEQKVFVWKELP